MKKTQRLVRSTDFQRVRRTGKSYAHPLIVIVTSPNNLELTRIGVAASKSVGNAPERNRAKRIMRVASDNLYADIKPGYDIIWIARKKILEVKSTELTTVCWKLLKQSGLLIDKKNG